ncbi:MAG: zinc-dependent metalloprotease [Deltaproteobacteria bacterium]|nr:zinc-dependent metalloprotease [Deltaproteobacteria bacterium]
MTGLGHLACDIDTSMSDEPSPEIVDNLRAAGFPAAQIEVRDDGVVFVGGDAEVSLQASREMAGISRDDDGLAFRQYRTNALVGPTIELICVDGTQMTGPLSTALDQAIANFGELTLGFEMVRMDSPSEPCDSVIEAVAQQGTSGSAGFPAFGLPFGTINIGVDVVDFGLPVATHLITHELGHCIGFRHTDFFDRSISCNGAPINEGPAQVGAINIPDTPTGAVADGSVMNSCYNLGSTGVWTGTDRVALDRLYGVATDDIIWRDGNGQVSYWRMNAGLPLLGLGVGQPVLSQWTLADVGDLDGDGTDDIIWRHDDGRVHYWPIVDGTNLPGVDVSGPVAAFWTLAGVGDVDGDGTDDIIWRHDDGRVHGWKMSGGQLASTFEISGPVHSSWTIEGVGDVDGDQTDDLVWRHSGGQVLYWHMQGGVSAGSGIPISSPVSSQWTLVGVGDLDGDGTDDIAWQHDNGQVHYWVMVGGVRVTGLNIGNPVGVGSSLAAIGDFD